MLYTVTIINVTEPDFEPWTTPFSSAEKADAFIASAREILKKNGTEDQWSITRDSSELDDTHYLDWLNDEDFGDC